MTAAAAYLKTLAVRLKSHDHLAARVHHEDQLRAAIVTAAAVIPSPIRPRVSWLAGTLRKLRSP